MCLTLNSAFSDCPMVYAAITHPDNVYTPQGSHVYPHAPCKHLFATHSYTAQGSIHVYLYNITTALYYGHIKDFASVHLIHGRRLCSISSRGSSWMIFWQSCKRFKIAMANIPQCLQNAKLFKVKIFKYFHGQEYERLRKQLHIRTIAEMM